MGPRTGVGSAWYGAIIGQNRHKMAKMWGKFLKKGANFGSLINILDVLDAEFNVDYDFVIKHDLILWCDWLMGVQSCNNSDDRGRVMVA